MGHVVIVPRRAVCSPVIEPLGFLLHHLPLTITHWSIALRWGHIFIILCILFFHAGGWFCVVCKVLIGEELDKEEPRANIFLFTTC